MEKFLKFLKTEAIGGHIIRFSLSGLLLFGGFTKLTLIGDVNYRIPLAVVIAAMETLGAIFLLYHFKRPFVGILGGILAFLCIIHRFIYSLFWVKTQTLGGDSFLEALQLLISTFNNGLFHILILLGAAVYCTGNSYKLYIKTRITQPWPK